MPTPRRGEGMPPIASGTALASQWRLQPPAPLLEIVLSLAILAGSLAALGEVMRLADRNAQMVRDESQAQILASSVMDELLSGSRLVASTRHSLITTPICRGFSTALDQAYVELMLARRIEQNLPAQQQPARFELVRWVPNPDYIATDTSQQSSTSSTSGSSSSQSSSGFGTSGTSGQSSGGQR
jgi:uncharacterized membrane protein YgcG